MTTVASVPITGFSVSIWNDRAISEEAWVLRKLINSASEFTGSLAIGEVKREARNALIIAYEAAQVEDWDCEGSKKAEPSTYQYADQFISLLPTSASLPEITVDRDGEILFEWDQGHRQIFSVSVGRDGTLMFAGLFGHTKIHGTEYLRDALPPLISDSIARLSNPAAY